MKVDLFDYSRGRCDILSAGNEVYWQPSIGQFPATIDFITSIVRAQLLPSRWR